MAQGTAVSEQATDKRLCCLCCDLLNSSQQTLPSSRQTDCLTSLDETLQCLDLKIWQAMLIMLTSSGLTLPILASAAIHT